MLEEGLNGLFKQVTFFRTVTGTYKLPPLPSLLTPLLLSQELHLDTEVSKAGVKICSGQGYRCENTGEERRPGELTCVVTKVHQDRIHCLSSKFQTELIGSIFVLDARYTEK